MRLETALLASVLLLPTTASAQVAGVSGIAFVDANGNGTRDQGEIGLAGVAVSNQDIVVTTDASGAFRLPRGGHEIVFVSGQQQRQQQQRQRSRGRRGWTQKTAADCSRDLRDS